MDRSFYYKWFKGFEKGLDEMDSDSRSCLLKHCAKYCADTGVLQSYQKLYRTVNGERDLFYSRLCEIGNVRGEIVVPHKEYFIYFPECGCDLHNDCGVNTPALCECSRQSILYLAKTIWNESNIQIEKMETILSGNMECKFRVIFD